MKYSQLIPLDNQTVKMTALAKKEEAERRKKNNVAPELEKSIL